MKQDPTNPDSDKAKAIFEAARAFGIGERAAYLAGACGDDAALRQKVDALLIAYEATVILSPEQRVAAPRGTILISMPDEGAGTTIDRYKLLQQIGEGGCGSVYMAEQSEPVRRRVALKVIKLGMDTKQVIARFEAERQALALMDHPNIAKVLDAGATDAGRPYFVMELVKGIPMTRFCDENHLNTAARLGLFIQVCHAIQHAHQKGIIHRDIKPSNILVADHDGVAVPKIIDFGIAKATTDQRLTDKTLFTAFEQFIGTPAYMSPEQAKLSGLDVDTRSDIYSLGVLLYELLVGETPFGAKSLLADGLDEIRRIIREEEPVRPSTKLNTLAAVDQTTVAKHRQADAPKLFHLIRGDLDWIVMKCLEKDRGRRYETANGLAMDIQRHLNNEPVIACPPGNLYRFQKMVRRNRLAFGAVGAVAASLILGLIISSYLLVREKVALDSEETMRRQAEEATKQAQTAAARAEASSREATTAERKARAKELESKKTLAASEYLQGSRAISDGHPSDALAYLARSFSDDPDNETALTTMANLLVSRSWMVPAVLLTNANSAQFSPDGKSIVTSSDDGTARVWDSRDGRPITAPLPHGHKVSSAEFSPDGIRIVTVSHDEARIWDARNGQPITEPLHHDGLVNSAQFSPDGSRLLTVRGASVLIWDAKTGKEASELRRRAVSIVTSAQFSPDGKSVLTAFGPSVRVWDAQDGRPLTETMVHNAVVTSAQFSPDGKRIVTASRDGTCRVWDAETSKQMMELLRHTVVVSLAQFSPDGTRIVAATAGGIVRIWDVQTGKLLPGSLTQDNRVNSVQFSPDGKRLLTASGTVARVWDAQNGKSLIEPLQHASTLNSVQFSPDGKRILTASRDGAVRVWEMQNSQPPLTEILTHGNRVSFAQFSPDGGRILTASDDGTARIWDAKTGAAINEPMKHGAPLISAHFSPNGKRIVTVSRDHNAQVWDAGTGKALTEPLRHPAPINSAQFSPDGTRILTAAWDGAARIWDAETGKSVAEPLKHHSRVTSARFSPDGSRIVTASADGTARIWDAQTGRQQIELQHGNFVSVTFAQFSPDEKRILTVSRDGAARIWDAQDGRQLTQVGGEVTSAQFSPDGKKVLTLSGMTARLWDAVNGQALTEPLQNTSQVNAAQFSPDGKRIVTATFSGGARVWDAQTGQQLMEPLTHNRAAHAGEITRFAEGGIGSSIRWPVSSAQFSPDGKRIVTASDDGTARVWDIAPSPSELPSWLPQLAEAISGQTLNKKGLLEPTTLDSVEIINGLRGQLKDEHKNDDWASWGRWFLSDPVSRTISPFSEQTLSTYREDRIKEGTGESLDEAERLAGDDERLLKQIADARSRLKQPTRAAMLTYEATSFLAQGKAAEANAKFDQAIAVSRQGSLSEEADTVAAMKSLADSCCVAGRSREAIAVLAKACEVDPTDTDASLTLATWQTWFGQESDYQAACRHLVQQADGTDQAATAERAAKSVCLRPSSDSSLVAKALVLAQKGVDLGKNSELLPWYQLTLGLAEFRSGQYAPSEKILTQVEQFMGDSHEMLGIVRFFRVMCVFRQGRTEEARQLFAQAAADMPALPQDESRPIADGKAASHDMLICWLAYKEAESMLNESAATTKP